MYAVIDLSVSTSSVCKVLEIFVRDSITRHLLSLDLLHSSQHGSRAGCSILTQLILMSNGWFSAFDGHVQTEVVCIDIAEAFDVVCRREPLQALY